MNCADARPLLDLLCDGVLEAKDSALILDHLKSCSECQGEWTDLEELHARFHETKDNPQLPAGLMKKISEKLRHDEKSQHKRFLEPMIYQITNQPLAGQTASAEALVRNILDQGTLEPVTDRNELVKKLGYELKYVRLPEWQVNKAGIYKAPGIVPIARFDFVRKGQSGDQYLSCYQAPQGVIQAKATAYKNLEGRRVFFGSDGQYQFALWSQSGRDYLFVTALPQPALEEIVRGT
jgi:hypothetical protein